MSTSNVLIAAVFLPVIAGICALIYSRKRRNAIKDMCCPSCGYSLRDLGTGVCPECGCNDSSVAARVRAGLVMSIVRCATVLSIASLLSWGILVTDLPDLWLVRSQHNWKIPVDRMAPDTSVLYITGYASEWSWGRYRAAISAVPSNLDELHLSWEFRKIILRYNSQNSEWVDRNGSPVDASIALDMLGLNLICSFALDRVMTLDWFDGELHEYARRDSTSFPLNSQPVQFAGSTTTWDPLRPITCSALGLVWLFGSAWVLICLRAHLHGSYVSMPSTTPIA